MSDVRTYLPHWVTLGAMSVAGFWFPTLALIAGIVLLLDAVAIWKFDR